jgi:hypothetical protein
MAYTKYSLTPSSNTAAPPDGAPEGMLPSAVNDTMRDMMAQIRDCGDGIRDGTYTMTAPKITGGTITGSTINNSAIGGTTAAAGAFTTLSATGVTTVQAGTVSLPAITTTGDTNTGIYFPAADTIAFTEGGAESMRITSAAAVIVNGTSTSSDDATYQSGGVFVSRRASSGGTTHATFLNGGSEVGSITSTTVATFYNTTSDYRLKTVIGSVSDAGTRLDALKPIEYDWKSGGRTRGFLAHEFAEVYPTSVSGAKDAIDKEGNPKYQSMQAATSEVMADLIAEIQSLRKRVAQLESK